MMEMFTQINNQLGDLQQAQHGYLFPLEHTIEYGVLNPWDENLITETAECLAETFAGVVIDGVRVSEPMTNAIGLNSEDMNDFVSEYLKNIVGQGLCVIARDKTTGKVIGAIASEDFNPEEELPVFEGSLEPMNHVISLLAELDGRFINAIESKTGQPVKKNQYIHAFMAGARMSNYKKFVVHRLVNLLMEMGAEMGYKGVFAEATNIRSARLLTDLNKFHLVYDLENNPVITKYANVPPFNTILPYIAEDCRILYKPIYPEYDI